MTISTTVTSAVCHSWRCFIVLLRVLLSWESSMRAILIFNTSQLFLQKMLENKLIGNDFTFSLILLSNIPPELQFIIIFNFTTIQINSLFEYFFLIFELQINLINLLLYLSYQSFIYNILLDWVFLLNKIYLNF